MAEKSFTKKILPLSNINNEEVGGKAKGLNKLLKCGLNVPEGFVILPGEKLEKIDEIKHYYSKLGNGKVAIRSSAVGEDSEDFSHAGQYKTFLNVEGIENVHKAVINCIESASSTQVEKYSENLSQNKESKVAVVVQRMINPSVSGVIFTLDPSTGEEKILINAVRGEGEALVSGKAKPDLYVLSREGKIIMREYSGEQAILSEQQIKNLVEQALYAEKHLSKALDMEWAIDKKGDLFWLQARPITTINKITINELDSSVDDSTIIFTRANVGEMLPGAVTPLTISVFVEAIDIGLKWMYERIGVYRKNEPGRYVVHFYNHLFFNLTKMYKIARCILGTSKDSFELNILGKTLDDTTLGPPIVFRKRLINSIKYFRFISKHKKALKILEKTARTFRINTDLSIPELYKEIDNNLDFYNKTWYRHYIVSSNSGMMNGALVGFISGGNNFTEEALTKSALLLTDIKNIESANIVTSLEDIAKEISSDTNKSEVFLSLSLEDAFHWLNDKNNGKIYELFSKFIQRHGHRCIREAELREKEWKENPLELISILQSLVKGNTLNNKNESNVSSKMLLDEIYKELNLKGIKLKIFNMIYRKAKEGMQNREYSKALSIKIHGEFRKAYRALGKKLVEVQIIPEQDLIYFLTHKEIGDLINNNNNKLVAKAQVRKKLFAQQRSLQFPEIVRGKPEPILISNEERENITEIKGTPVSHGVVRGKVRIVKSVEDAEKIEAGEIMVASFTDIGWSPYYALISGLVTEIGGSLSHGAIVAREYGLPLVSNVSNATKLLKTGQEIILDGTKGIITIIKK
ncbi:MAG: hypothetical protein K9W46_12450 [Candidatus Heimdallarchaeum endolithica]|uniref:Phosphoenolpyruvate synthase n=1 Tax=Candidatus Heimdallarchaeum endolithica TaxID=2876572 RepID=A0A9Y1BQI0_9ARCH|nr:MAG: hypothetical protein K9W46_12450 [Candidatus Heimdallarchaeum endolithica]